jgi:hypothetical protein
MLDTFISHALASGRTLAEVRIAIGHRNLAVTSLYLPAAHRVQTPSFRLSPRGGIFFPHRLVFTEDYSGLFTAEGAENAEKNTTHEEERSKGNRRESGLCDTLFRSPFP